MRGRLKVGWLTKFRAVTGYSQSSNPGSSTRACSAKLAPVVLLFMGTAVGACTASSYLGIPLRLGAADIDLQELTRRARLGDKHSQLELGIRFEEGRGVPVDLSRAEQLYRLAARRTGGTQLIFVPAATDGGRAAVRPMSKGRSVEGLLEAQVRLERIIHRKKDGFGERLER